MLLVRVLLQLMGEWFLGVDVLAQFQSSHRLGSVYLAWKWILYQPVT